MGHRTSRKGHRFGGDWTTQKLQIVQAYLKSYTTALKNKPFRTLYIDGFAGTGYREHSAAAHGQRGQELLFPDLIEEEPQKLLDGSARLALGIEPPFDEYHFFEQRVTRCRDLEGLKTQFAQLADRIHVQAGDANLLIQDLCRRDWRRHRAVLFLDPYGMQVDWATIEAVAGTCATDLWLLFPLGIGVNRLLTRSGEIPPAWRARLNQFLGTEDWYEEFYRFEPEATLFGNDSDRVVKASTEIMGGYFARRLSSVFAGVARQPAVLVNSRGNPLYLLCFAAGNRRGAPIALDIAEHLLRRVR